MRAPTFVWVRRVLLPLLLAVFEAAWVYPWALVIGFSAGAAGPLLPGWALALLIALPALSTRLLHERGWPVGRVRGAALALGAAIGLAVLWVRYFRDTPPLDPRWIGDLISQVATGERLPAAALAGLLGIYLWGRGLLTANKIPTFSETWRSFAAGVLVTAVLVVLAAAYRRVPGWQAAAHEGFPAIVFFLFAGFVAVALARLTEVWEETRVRGEPPVLNRHWLAVLLAVVAAMVGVSLLLSALVGFNLASLLLMLLRPLARAAEWLLALMFWILEPIIAVTVAFVAELFAGLRGRRIPMLDRASGVLDELRRRGLSPGAPLSPDAAQTVRWFTVVGGLVLLILVLAFLIVRAQRAGGRRTDEDRESVFSGREVLAGLAQALRSLGRRGAGAPLDGPPEVVAVRRIYRDLLRLGERLGWPRGEHQTPYEYLGVLAPNLPAARDDLLAITETYVRARYGPDGVTRREVDEASRSLERVRASPEAVDRAAPSIG